MDESVIREFAARLEDELRLLADGAKLGAEDRTPVELDQQATGRLSRMDALQRQAMANATARRVEARRAGIRAALDRIRAGEFGYCLTCGEDISRSRLNLDPALPTCIDCARR